MGDKRILGYAVIVGDEVRAVYFNERSASNHANNIRLAGTIAEVKVVPLVEQEASNG